MKKYFVTLCLCTAFLLLTACGGTSAPTPSVEPESQEPTISLEEYKTMVSNFSAKIMDEALILANTGQYEYSYWKAFDGISNEITYGDMDYDAMVEHAMEWLAENSDYSADTVNAAYDDLIATYADISDANVDGELPTDIATLVDALFGAYQQLYSTVTKPSGELRDFLTTLSDSSKAIMSFNDDLTALLNS